MNEIEMRKLIGSSNLAAYGYDEASETLRIKFNSGQTWDYPKIRPGQALSFAAAQSKGKFFAQYIRNRKDDAGKLIAGERVS